MPRWCFLLYALGALVLLGAVSLSWQPRPVLTVRMTGAQNLVDLRTTQPLTAGQLIPARAAMHTQQEGAELSFFETQLIVGPNTDVDVHTLTNEQVELMLWRGSLELVPDRSVQTCSRELCVRTSDPLRLDYYTPGERLLIRAKGDVEVAHRLGAIWYLHEGDELLYDELQDTVSLNEL